MKGKYTHKFVIFHKLNIRNDYLGLVSSLAEFSGDPIPGELLEVLEEKSPFFKKRRHEFYLSHKNDLNVIEEILRIDEETNVAANKVLAFVHKYPSFKSLISGIDYFDGEDEYIEPFLVASGNADVKFYQRYLISHYYGVSDNRLDIFLKEIGREDLIQI